MVHVADPQVCAVVVHTLAETGTGGQGPLLLALAALLIAAAIAIAFVVRAHRRTAAEGGKGRGALGSGSAAALALLAAVAMSAAALGTAPPALAAPSDNPVQYSDGCELFGVADVNVTGEAVDMLPGDSAVVISATVTNKFDGPISITVSTAAEAGSELVPSTTIDGAVTNTATLAKGATATIEISVTLPMGADNSLQGSAAGLTITISGVES